MKILFANLSSLKFDVTTPEREPLGGSESSLCYLARQLAKNGHNIALAARLPEGTAERTEGVAHRPVAVLRDPEFFAAEKFDAVVTVNASLACPGIAELSPQSLNILWDHLPPDQEAVRALGNTLLRGTIDGIVYVSPWQQTETEKLFGAVAPGHVIANGVTPSFENMFASKQELLAAKQNRAAYTSVPGRGLAELLEALPQDVPLDVFSSMRVYQTDDAPHIDVLRRARDMPQVTCHGSVSQRELAAQLKSSALLTYPCIQPETFCLAALEGLAAGMKVIATDVGGIAFATMGYADLLQPDAGQSRAQFISTYRQLLEKNVAKFSSNHEAWAERAFTQSQKVSRECTWAVRAQQWGAFLAGLMRRNGTVETQWSSG